MDMSHAVPGCQRCRLIKVEWRGGEQATVIDARGALTLQFLVCFLFILRFTATRPYACEQSGGN